MAPIGTVTREVTPDITTFTTPFNRFAPLGYRRFVAVGNRATAIRLRDGRVLLLNPIQLEPGVISTLTSLGGVDFVASDLGHHMYVKEYLDRWPNAKAIGVPGLQKKRKDVEWTYIYEDWRTSPEDQFDFAQDIETVLFEGFITFCVAWYHKPSKTLIQSDLLMNLPATEQYNPSSAHEGPASREFAKRAHPRSIWSKRLMYYIATVDFTLMRRDAKRIAELDIDRIIPCHGDVLETGGQAAWSSQYEWYLQGNTQAGAMKALLTPFMKIARSIFLM